jgi:hypothetical protein
VAPHIRYAHALAHRANYDWENAQIAYEVIMKQEDNINEYRNKVDMLNRKIMDDNITDNAEGLDFKIDLYSHFKDKGLVR